MTSLAALVLNAGTQRQILSSDTLLVGAAINPTSGALAVGSAASAITIGGGGITTSFPGPVALTGGITTVGGTTFTTSATFQGDVTFGTDGGADGPDTVAFVASIASNIAMDGSSIDSGTATSGGASTLTDSGAAWTVNQYAGNLVQITAGTGIGQSRVIASNTATVLTATVAWATAPDNTSVYSIIGETFRIRNLEDPTLPHDAASKAYVDAATGGATLQSAYVNGNTITTSAGEGAVVIAGDQNLSLTTTGGVVGTALTGAVNLQTTGAVTIKGGASAAFGDDVASLDFDGAGAVSETGMTSLTLTPSGLVSITAGAASTLATTAGDITIDAQAASVIVDGGEAAADAVRIVASNAAGGIDIDAGTAGITIDTTGAFSIDGVGASNVSATSGNLTLSTITSGDVILATPSAASALVVKVTTGRVGIGNSAPTQQFTVGAASEFAVSSGGKIKNYNGAAPTDGQVLIGNTAGASFDAAALTAGTGISITNGAGSVTIAATGAASATAIDVDTTAFEALAINDLVTFVNDGGVSRVQKADSNDTGRQGPVGFTLAAASTNGDPVTVRIAGVAAVAAGRFDSAPAAANVGQRVWMSTTPGKITLTAPTATNDVVQRIGILTDGSGSPKVLVQIGEPITL